MAYIKTAYLDEVLAGAERYDIKENGGGAFKSNMQVVLATVVTTPGTALDAAHLNNAENQIEYLSKLASAQLLVGNASGDSTKRTITGDVTIGNTGVTAITAGAIVNADINAAAGIVGSKLAAAAGIVGTQLASKTVAAAQIADATITTTQIAAAASITDAQLVRRKISNRKGGSATDWTVTGSTDYAVTESRMQCGSALSSNSANVQVFFPVAFAYPPVVIATPAGGGVIVIFSVTTTYFYAFVKDTFDTLYQVAFSWLAIGPA